MKAIVIGATGATGKFLVQELISSDSYSEVTVLVRKKAFVEHPKLKQIVVDFDNLTPYQDEIKGDVAFSCMGTTLKAAGSKVAQWKIDYDYQYHFAELAEKNNVPIFVLVSAMNAKSDSSIFYSKMKGELEEAIVQLNFAKTIIFQPGILERPNTDRGGEKIALSVTKFFARLGVIKKHLPTHVHDLAKAMIASVHNSEQGVSRIHVKEIHRLAKEF
jgi:uncharacterized protein YbjT (DUF2867 family)